MDRPVSTWALNLELAPPGGPPVFLQIARALSDAVRIGRLRPGQRLPGSRRMAEALGVHRNTVLAAYAELAAEGWIDAAHGRGTFVSTAIPDERPRPAATGDLNTPYFAGLSWTTRRSSPEFFAGPSGL